MKILIVSQMFWPESFKINDFALSMKARGHEVSVLTGKPNYPLGKFYPGYSFFGKGSEVWNGIPVLRCPVIPRFSGKGIWLIINYFSFVLFGSIWTFFLRFRPDVIFVWESSPVTVGIPAIVAKWRKNAPIHFWVQDLWPHSLEAGGGITQPRILKLADWITRFIYRRCDKILVQSTAFQPIIVSQGVSDDKIIYLPNWAEEWYRPVEIDPNYGLYFPGKRHILFAGNIGESQDFETLLSAAKLHKSKDPELHWIILGDGRMRKQMEAESHKKGVSDVVHFLGSFPPKEMPKFFAHADILLFSLKRNPIFSLTIPSKLQSYLACGRPVAGAIDGIAQTIIVDNQLGVCVPAESPLALSIALEQFFNLSLQQKNEMAQRALDYSQKYFNKERILNGFEQLCLTNRS